MSFVGSGRKCSGYSKTRSDRSVPSCRQPTCSTCCLNHGAMSRHLNGYSPGRQAAIGDGNFRLEEACRIRWPLAGYVVAQPAISKNCELYYVSYSYWGSGVNTPSLADRQTHTYVIIFICLMHCLYLRNKADFGQRRRRLYVSPPSHLSPYLCRVDATTLIYVLIENYVYTISRRNLQILPFKYLPAAGIIHM